MIVRSATIEDASELAPRLRKADQMEIQALGLHALSTLQTSVTCGTETYSVVADDGRVIAMFGLNHFGGQDPLEACIWMVASDDLKSIKTVLMRDTPKYLSRFHSQFPLLWNIVDARNQVHINWLKRFGFVGLTTHYLGHFRLPFIEFVRLDHSPCAPSPQPA